MRGWLPSEEMLAGPAAARKATFLRRATHNAICALGLVLITGSLIPLVVCYPLLVVMLALDVEVGQRFLRAPSARKRVMSLAFMAMSVAAIGTYALMALVGAWLGGADGRLAAMFMAAGSLVTIIVLMVEAPLYMVLSAAPCAILLAVVPLLPNTASPTQGMASTLGLYMTFGVFAHQLYRTASHHIHLFNRNSMSREVAERRRAEAELRRGEAEERRREAEIASRVKSEFLTAMTHELRTPLNAVINYAEIIQEDSKDGVAEDAGRVVRSAHHLLRLIDRVLDFSELQSGAAKLDHSELDLAELAREALAAQRDMMRAQSNTGAVFCFGASAPIRADRRRLGQCLESLISNAARFTANGSVEITIKPSGTDWRVTIADTGVGMTAEQLASAFNAFTQAEAAHTRRADGLGLGLSTARLAAQLMGGDIIAESAPGAGSRFTLILPQVSVEPARAVVSCAA